jgi:hypothetical protein
MSAQHTKTLAGRTVCLVCRTVWPGSSAAGAAGRILRGCPRPGPTLKHDPGVAATFDSVNLAGSTIDEARGECRKPARSGVIVTQKWRTGAPPYPSRPDFETEYELMKTFLKIAAVGLAAVALTACVEDSTTRSSTGMREASGNAESACMSAVNSRFDGKVNDIVVTSSEFSQANDLVMLKAGGQTWKCLVSDDGQVQELSVVGR